MFPTLQITNKIKIIISISIIFILIIPWFSSAAYENIRINGYYELDKDSDNEGPKGCEEDKNNNGAVDRGGTNLNIKDTDGDCLWGGDEAKANLVDLDGILDIAITFFFGDKDFFKAVSSPRILTIS